MQMDDYCSNGKNCLTCKYEDCIFDRITCADIAESMDRDRETRLENMDAKQRRIAAQKREYREANREKIADYQREYYQRTKRKNVLAEDNQAKEKP